MFEYSKIGEFNFPHPVIGMGAELKNTVSLGYRGNLYMSPCIGDLEDPDNATSHDNAVREISLLSDEKIAAVAVDLHPDMYSTLSGKSLAEKMGIPVFEVQHHHAHAVSCMVEHDLPECLALVYDGTGLGTDGTVWGAELLYSELASFQRLASFAPVPLPGGDAAVRQPARQLVARWFSAGMKIEEPWLRRIGVTPEVCEIWISQCQKSVNAPLSHSAGRLFDAFSMLLGLSPQVIQFEAQPAINLEAEAQRNSGDSPQKKIPYSTFEKNNLFLVDWSPAFREHKIPDIDGQSASLANSFHKSVAEASVEMIEYGLSKRKTRNIVLSGGCFVNRLLRGLLLDKLEKRGLKVFINKKMSVGDGGISAGQVVAATARMKE